MERDKAVAREFQREQAYVDRCLANFERLVKEATKYAEAATATPIESSEDLFTREVRLEHGRKWRSLTNINPDRLVLGRIDLDTDETFYVGRIGIESEDDELLVLDWRAPLSALFYQATAAKPTGVARRRSLSCDQRKVVEINDEVFRDAENFEPVIGEAGLLRALGRHRGRYMADIVGTIQADQDVIIRHNARDSVVVSGGPGTGKTVVALHRVAYVLYERAEELERRGVLVIGPSERFADYISKVLPSLGETAVQVRSAASLIELSNGTSVAKRRRWDIAMAKGTAGAQRFLRRAAVEALPPIRTDVIVQLGSTRLSIKAEDALRLREGVLLASSSKPVNAARRALADAIMQHLADELSPAARTSDEFIREVGYCVDELLPIRSAFETWTAIMHSAQVASRLAGSLGGVDLAEDILQAWRVGQLDEDDLALICVLDEILGDRKLAPWDEVDDQDQPLLREVWSYQDKLDQKRARTDIRLRKSNFGLVVIDEAQDLTPIQLRAIKSMGGFATWLVVGDDSQAALRFDSSFVDRFRTTIAAKEITEFSLEVNYRTPVEVVKYAQHVCNIDRGSSTVYVRKFSELPSVGRLPEDVDRAAVFSTLKSTHDWAGSTAVIVPENMLAGPWPDGSDVLTPTESKGLEWDNVVAVLPEDFDAGKSTEAPCPLAYVALTRPTRRLLVLTQSKRFTPDGLFQPWQFGKSR